MNNYTQEIVLGTVGIVPGKEWNEERPYEALTAVTRSGSSYLSLRKNTGIDPELDKEENFWMLIAKRGESWYELCVSSGRFEGTEEEFLNEKQAQIDAAKQAADDANQAIENINTALSSATEAETRRTENENRRVDAENARVSAEDTRVKNEQNRELLFNQKIEEVDSSVESMNQLKESVQEEEGKRSVEEQKRVDNESTRQSNETIRIANEDGRGIAEQGRITGEENRVQAEILRSNSEVQRETNETSRKNAEVQRELAEQRRQESMESFFESTESALSDMSDSIGLANSAIESINNLKNTISSNEDERILSENSRVEEEVKRNSAEQNRVSSEEQRVQNESQRQSNENARIEAETQRSQNETNRNEAEELRVEAENKREADTQDAIRKCDEAVNNVQDTISQLEPRIQSIEDNYNTLKSEINDIRLSIDNYGVASWPEDDLAPECTGFFGNLEFLNKWNVYLLDTTDNAGDTTTPVGKLMRNNLLRFEDGSFAPTVGITEEMRAECDVELYLDEAHQQKYCNAGEFNAETFYNEHGMAKLYNAEGTEVRVLRPWETTETKYTIGIGRDETVYLLDNVKGKSGRIWKGLFATPTVWDGIDVSDYPLPPTAMSPSPVCTIDTKPRSFFYLYEGETNCRSSAGQNNLCTMFQNGRTYPRVNDMNQMTNMQRARSMNADTSRSYPFSEGGFHALNTYVTAQEVLYGTKYLHKNTFFGSGISSNDTCNSEATWKQNGGVRYKLSGSGTWKYANWNAQGDIYYTADDHKRTNFSTLLNLEHPKEQCMESQMVASFASETGIQPGVEFEFYGGTYWYENVPNASGLSEGGMNVRVFKRMSTTFNAYDSAGAEQSWDVEIILRMSLVGGMNLSGDVFAYWGGGLENVGTHAVGVNTSRAGNPVDLYLEPDQKKWHSETLISKADKGVFDFEAQYRKLGTATNLGNGYASKRHPYSNWKTEKGGSISTGECLYVYDDNYWGSVLNTRYRIGSRFRGHATSSYCSSRYLYAYYAVSLSYRYFAGSAQALIGGAAPLQAE